MSQPPQAEPSSSGPAHGVRLELKPGTARTGFVDGGWWPRSRDLRAQLPDLVAALHTRIGGTVGPIQRIGFGRSQWDPIGKERLVTATGQVAFDGFQAFTPDLVWMVGRFTDQTPITLLVVPPETSEADATEALRRAATAGNTERPATLLAPAGLAPTSGARNTADTLVRS
jgi:hypothetical protein